MPSARLPVVEFRSLLSPPIRLPLRAFHSLFRPQCSPSRMSARRPPQCLEQRRNLVLYKTAKAETVLGMHKLLPFDLYHTPPPDASEHLVKLEVGGRVIENISLQDVYEKYIRPGHILYLKDGPSKADASDKDGLRQKQLHTEFKTYGILKAETLAGNKKQPHAGKGRGALRVTHINLSSPTGYLKIAMDRSYQFIKHESPVEFVLAITRKADKDKKKRLAPTGPDLWHWTHEHFPHLRPDFILKSMPEGSRFVVDPVSDGKVVQFVIAATDPTPLTLGYSDKREEHIPDSLTKRLLRVKASVEKSIKEGKQAQLPMVYRQILFDSGNTSYHRSTGLPITKESGEGMVRDASDTAITDSRRRYMPEKPQEDEALPPKMRMDKLNRRGDLMDAVPAKKWERRSKAKQNMLAEAMSRKPARWEGRGTQG